MTRYRFHLASGLVIRGIIPDHNPNSSRAVPLHDQGRIFASTRIRYAVKRVVYLKLADAQAFVRVSAIQKSDRLIGKAK